MLPSEELLQSIDIIAQNAAKNGVKIYTAIVTAVGDNNTCSVRINGKTHSNIAYYGDVPSVNKSYRVFCPNGSMNQAFIITGGGSSGGGSTGATDYNQLINRPSINGTILSGNQTSSQLGLYGTNNAPPYPVTSVNGQTGNVVISTGGNVDSVNGKTGAVVLNAADVGALPSTTTIPDKTSQLDNDSGYITNSALTDYAKKTEIPTKTSQLDNDANYITAAQAPVQSVNNKTGVVTLSAADVSAIPSTLTGTAGQVLTKTADGQEWKDVEIPNDHSKLSNRDVADQHPIGAITGLEAALANIPPTDAFIVTLTQDEAGTYSVDKTFAEIQTEIQSNRTVYLYFQEGSRFLSLVAHFPDVSVVFGFVSVASSAVHSLFVFVFHDDHVEFQQKTLSKLPNPNALTFTGAVTGSYDGSAPLSVEIPSGGGGGISATARNLLITILRNGVYSSDQSSNITELEKALGGTEIAYYTITNNLTNVTNSNSAGSIQEKTAYIASLTAVDGYAIDSVSVTMGGVDVTIDVYADGVINISSVTGDVEIVASATAVSTEPVLNTDGLVFDYDFRNARMESYNLSGWGNVYRTIDKTGTALLFGTAASTGDGVGLADYNFFEQRLVSSETQKLTLGSSYTAQFLYRSQTLGGTRAQPDMLSWAYNTNFIYKIYLKPKYLVDTTETTVTDTEAVDIDVADYAVITYVVDGTKLTVYYNNSIIYDLDGSNYDGFTKWVDYGVPDTVYNKGYAVSFVGYNRALSEVEIVDNIEYFKTLEVTA